ncbi:UDP-3-O-(3-hydroxymyristoyl)glucosamine N-acyltransferase [Rhodobacteraceae bacterium NNCM2]|nr:UDP-3-O-(3-hydroxymyristoyl)glucosamine N-acyltransferase [Coraliihabitans acroporae]
MAHTIADIAASTGLAAEGNVELSVSGAAEPASAGASDLALAMDEKFADDLKSTAARAAVLWEGADWRALGLDAVLFAPRPKIGLAAIGDVFDYPLDIEPGIHPTALIHPTANIAEDCWIGPYAIIGARVHLGRGARVLGQCTIGADAHIGEDAVIFPGVRIGPRVRAGDRLFIQYNAVIGGEGFSYLTPEKSSVESAKETGATKIDIRNTGLRRINSLGSVVLGDDVDIGASATIDRGTISDTRVGNGSKIDNMVMLGHNVIVGETCMLCAQVGIAGSTKIGDRVVLGGRVGCADHCEIGSDVIVGGGSLIGANIPSGKVMMGIPVLPRDKFFEQQVALRRLPRLVSQVADMRKKLGL